MTYQQLLTKLTAYCAKAERCIHEVQMKMQRWAIDEETQSRAIRYLLDERYIDEERYARYFINDKLTNNKWGKRKVEQALYAKHIPSEIYADLLLQQDEESYADTLIPLLRNKKKSLATARSTASLSAYEIRGRLMRFALQRGFTYDQTLQCLDSMDMIKEE